MKLSANLVIQILSTIIQGANAVSGSLPPKWQATLAVSVGLIQAVTAVIAHFSTPPKDA